jgi:hypothetical protein
MKFADLCSAGDALDERGKPRRRFDLVTRDNRATLYRARRFDRSQVRDLRHAREAGDGPTIPLVEAA